MSNPNIMRVMWFTNVPMPAACSHQGFELAGSGTWMSGLLETLAETREVKLAVVCAFPGMRNESFEENGITYYTIGQSCWDGLCGEERYLQACVRIVNEWQPDLVHIHGTERFYGLLPVRQLISVPSLVTIQGLIHAIVPKMWGSLSLLEALQTPTWRQWLFKGGTFGVTMRRQRQARMGEEILRSVNYYTGQTWWDRSHVRAYNPKARYWPVGRVLRPPFYQRHWNLHQCRRNSIIFTNASSPLRDVESLIKSVLLLRKEFPDIRLRLAGSVRLLQGYGRLVGKKLATLGKSVEFLGFLGPDQMVQELCKSHVYAIASHIENESNSLCEAMLLGMPCVASYAGGMPSMIDEGRSGLMFPPGEPALLAAALRRILSDDDQAATIGNAAREAASLRHNPATVACQQLRCYKELLQCESAVRR